MKLAFVTDLQLDSNPPCDHRGADGKSIRFGENNATITTAFDAAVSHGAQGWLFGGDASEKKNPPSEVQRALAQHFKWWMQRGMPIIAIPGNHDGSNFGLSSSSIEPLGIMAGDGLTLYQSISYDPTLRAIYIPYIHRASPQEIRAMLVEVMAPHAATLGDAPIFAMQHYGARGATVGAANSVLQSDYLGADLYAGYPVDHVMVAHIHKAQESVEGGIAFHTAGSPVICNHGERADKKTFGIFDTVTREYTSYEIKQKRDWVAWNWDAATLDIASAGDQVDTYIDNLPWDSESILTVTGTHPRDQFPKEILEKAFKAGVPRPFYLRVDAKPEREERVSRANVSAEEGLREGMRKFVQENYTRESDEPGQVGGATALAMDTVTEAGGAPFCTEIRPASISIRGFATILELDYNFEDGVPVLVLGENGIGKSNFQAALYWAQTGELPNGMGLTEAVNRTLDACVVVAEYLGRSPEHEEQRFRVRRSVKIGKDGATKHDLSVDRLDTVTGAWDEKTMNDGGIKERQATLNRLLGGSAMVQRIANFSVQDDNDAFIKSHPKTRKVVIGEVTGQDPLKKAHKKLDAGRLEAQRALEDGKQRLSGVLAVAEGAAERLTTLEGQREAAEGSVAAGVTAVPVADAAVLTAAGALDTAQAALTKDEAALAALPNTGAVVASAQSALDSYQSSYVTTRNARLADHAKASTDAASLEAEVGALAVPDPAEVERLWQAALAATNAAIAARAARDVAATTAAGAEATAAAAVATLDRAKVAHQATEEALAAAPAAQDIPALEAAVTAAATEAEGWKAQVEPERKGLHEAHVKATGIEQNIARLRQQLADFDGKDVGACSRCGQVIDSKHIEADIARINEEIEEANRQMGLVSIESWERGLAATEEKVKVAEAALATARQAHADAVSAAAVRARLGAAAAEAAAARVTAESAALEASAAASAAAEALTTAEVSLATATATEQVAAGAHRTAADTASTAATLYERLRNARARMAELVEAGTKDKAAYDGRVAELTAALTTAATNHAAVESQRGTLGASVVLARALVGQRQQQLAEARVALGSAQSRLEVTRTTLASITAQITTLREQVALAEQSRLEVRMLTEQAQITSLAVSIVEDFRLALIDNAIPFLEDRSNHWLEKLGAGTITARFTTRDGDKDTLDVLIDDGKPGRALDIACYSGGQKRRVEMAVKRALNELKRQSVGVTLGFHGYDEPTDGLDAVGKQAFVDMVMNDGGVQIITSHDDSIIAAFDHQIRLVRGVQDETVIEEA